MSFPWISESELDTAEAEHEAGDILGDDGRADQRKIDTMLEHDPEFRAWADHRYAERWGTPRPTREPDIEAGQ